MLGTGLIAGLSCCSPISFHRLRHLPPPQVHVTCDNARYECGAPSPIAFRPTMMYATRAFALRVTNTAVARLDYIWRVVDAEGRDDASGALGPQWVWKKRSSRGLRSQRSTDPPTPNSTHTTTPKPPGLYTLTPSSGTIAPGASEDITLRFSPTEVEDCDRVLVCTIPDLDPSCQPLTRAVNGKVRLFSFLVRVCCFQADAACSCVIVTLKFPILLHSLAHPPPTHPPGPAALVPL
jgi:hypothetical protein